MRITVNGEERAIPEGVSVAELLKALNIPKVGVAVAVNFEVVQRQALEATRIQEGDRVEIIRAVQGG
ncbi:MAG: thiamine biosynthesis protein ThiS [Candidatus Handelsmanbacteria bacterium RIFCSPLOWO2_12_FULL_64_10]|uniref:Thiamine biosynthesis protein ThiS n=1 Tax=Handelsmanbacteria sp. (strain RIFCSPLOWO2_12_FULL_64_10) TaxID=1817868 RepID=A0A1F6CSU2_HANXR|nr:MAG: thiamine biosynthesis protein ThiS [Candidatus Handelsmanbacteria bacterium RIFCSPLOWO2_12_FULL_64_10]